MTEHYKSTAQSKMMAQEQELHMVQGCSCFDPFMLPVITLSMGHSKIAQGTGASFKF